MGEDFDTFLLKAVQEPEGFKLDSTDSFSKPPADHAIPRVTQASSSLSFSPSTCKVNKDGVIENP